MQLKVKLNKITLPLRVQKQNIRIVEICTDMHTVWLKKIFEPETHNLQRKKLIFRYHENYH